MDTKISPNRHEFGFTMAGFFYLLQIFSLGHHEFGIGPKTVRLTGAWIFLNCMITLLGHFEVAYVEARKKLGWLTGFTVWHFGSFGGSAPGVWSEDYLLLDRRTRLGCLRSDCLKIWWMGLAKTYGRPHEMSGGNRSVQLKGVKKRKFSVASFCPSAKCCHT